MLGKKESIMLTRQIKLATGVVTGMLSRKKRNNAQSSYPSIYFLFCLCYIGSQGEWILSLWTQGVKHCGCGAKTCYGCVYTHPFTHFGQFRDANQSMVQVFRRKPEKAPEAYRGHTSRGNQTSYPGGTNH